MSARACVRASWTTLDCAFKVGGSIAAAATMMIERGGAFAGRLRLCSARVHAKLVLHHLVAAAAAAAVGRRAIVTLRLLFVRASVAAFALAPCARVMNQLCLLISGTRAHWTQRSPLGCTLPANSFVSVKMLPNKHELFVVATSKFQHTSQGDARRRLPTLADSSYIQWCMSSSSPPPSHE